MASNSKKPGNLTNLPPEVLQELIRIEQSDKQNDPQKKQNDQMMQALLAATGAVNGLMELKTGIDQNHQQTFSALQDTHTRLSDAVEALNSNDQTGNFQQVVQGLDKLSREIQLKLVDVEKAAQSKPEIKPNIKVDAPKVNVTVDKPDLKPLQNLLKTELPKQVKALADAIPEVPETDLSTVEKSLKDMISVMQEVRDRKIPIPQFPTNMKVVNPDGTPIAGGSGGGGTQYTSGGAAVANPTGNSLIYFNGSNVPVAVTSANPLPITGTISVGSTADSSAFTAGTSTTGPIAGVFNDSVAALTSGQQGTIRATNNRGLHMNLRNVSGTEIATSSNPIRIDPTGTTTQPISLASTTITGTVAVTQSTSPWVVSNGGTFAVQATQSGTWNITNISGTVSLPTGAATAAKQPALGTAGTPSTDVLSVQGESGMTALKVDGSAVTQPISSSSLPLPTGAATSANQTNASQKTQIVDGSGNVIASTSNALNVAITSGGGSGGTSSSFGATFPTTGTAIGAKNGANMVNLLADASNNLLVNLSTALPTGSNAIGSITNTSFVVTQPTAANLNATVVGTVTANAGTNLNTSLLALESGGNLASIKTDVDNLNLAQASTTSGQKGNLILGATTTAAPTYTTAQSNPLSLTTVGALRTDASATTQPVSGTVTANAGTGNFVVTQPTASNLNATVVGTGTFAVQAAQGTATALSAGWPVINGELSDTTGTFTNATQTTSVTAPSLDGYGNVLISINGTYGTATAVFEGSDDGGTTWYGISEADRTDSNIIESGYTTLTNTNRAWQISNPGWDSIRVRSTAVASGTVNVRISPSAAPTAAGNSVSIGAALPAGANSIGTVAIAAAQTIAVTNAGTFVTQPTIQTGTNSIGKITDITASVTPGTAAANLGKAEDAAAVSGDTGVFVLGVRNDNAATSVVNANGDYAQLSVDTNGTLFTRQAPNNTPTLTNVASSITSVTLLAANAARRNFIIYNDSTSDCYIKYGTTASSTSFTYYLPSLGTLQDEFYAGRIDAIWISAAGNARVTEVSV